MPDFLTSTKPSVIIQNAPWPKNPTMSTSDANNCIASVPISHGTPGTLGLYLSSISSSASSTITSLVLLLEVGE